MSTAKAGRESPEAISGLVAAPIAAHGLDLEDVAVVGAGPQTTVRVLVDADERPDLEKLARVSEDCSAALDAADLFGDRPYVLEVSTPGVGRPLTEDRHFRRARGRLATLTLAGHEPLVGRLGVLEDASEAPEGEAFVTIVVREGRRGAERPVARRVPRAQIRRAVVEVEFSPPPPAELELAGLTPPPSDPLEGDRT